MKRTFLIITALFACVIFFASCKKEEFTVTFNPNGGKGSMSLQTFKAGKSQALTANSFTNGGYTFMGWNTNSSGAGTAYKDQEIVKISSNTVLFAQWAIVDIDGNAYKTVQIGTQCWMKENLKTTKYNTGEPIPVITGESDWFNATTGAMCYYDNNKALSEKNGALYNGYTALSGKLCPEGWRVPATQDWSRLCSFLGGYDVAAYKMKTDYGWNESEFGSGNGSNESGFTALPVGMRVDIDQLNFYGLGFLTSYWSSVQNFAFTVVNNNSALLNVEGPVESGISVRCIKD
jgi:uncharacterized protein (TIGR02145 family)